MKIVNMVARKRRVIQEDDEDNDEQREFDSDGGGPSIVQVEEEEEKPNVATSMVDRLKRRAAKTAEAAQQKHKRMKLKMEDSDKKKNSPSGSPNKAIKAIKKEQSIPKKPKKTQTIPKKSNDDEDNKKKTNEDDKIKKETPSLLSGMKKPPIHKVNTSKNKSFPLSRGSTNSGEKAPRSAPRSPLRSSPVQRASTPPTHSPGPADLTTSVGGDNTGDAGGSDKKNIGDRGGVGIKSEEGEEEKFGSGLRQLVWGGLRDLCKNTFAIPPERNGVDLYASFLRHKDLKSTMQTNNNGIDSNSNDRYDFFDVDETTGTIVVQPKIPIFPEDFPPGGIQEWPMSWWGIVDPSIGERKVEEKAKSKTDADRVTQTKPRRDRSGAKSSDRTSPERKDVKGDRNKRDNSRSARKRSSRDRHEDEHAYYDDYPPWEDHRDRFSGGEFDDGGGGYPPPFRASDYDFDHNGPPPNGHHHNFRHPHHRGSGPPFPHRMGDGPPPHARPYSRDGPPPGDFRGGGRPHPAHHGGGGDGPPWNHSHRDPYGPQGRGPPLPHDDRRENRDRDRPRRPPHSKSERDDGRNAGRKSTGSSSNRKDRTRPSR